MLSYSLHRALRGRSSSARSYSRASSRSPQTDWAREARLSRFITFVLLCNCPSPRFKLGHFYNCRTYFQCSGSYWRQRWREAAQRWCWMSGIRNLAVNLPSEPEHLYSLIHSYWTNDSATTDQDHQLKTSWPFEIDTSTKNYALDDKFLPPDTTWTSIWHLLISE